MASLREIEMGPVGEELPRGDVVAATPRHGRVVVEFTEGSASLLVDWLRDNCLCDQCRIVQTDERRWQPWTQPGVPEVNTVQVVDGRMEVEWKGGHQSVYGRAQWDKIRTTASRGRWTARLWDSAYEIERYDHDQCIADLVTRRGVFEALRRDGAVVVTGSPTEPGSVISLLQA